MSEDQSKRDSDARMWRVIGIVAGVAVVMMTAWAVVVWCWADGTEFSKPGAFGDSFAPLVGLMTSLTLGAALASVIMQREELRLQRDEMKLQRKAMEDQREEMEEARKQWTAQAASMVEANKHAADANMLARAVKRSEIAGQVLASCFEALDALRYVSDDDVPDQWSGHNKADKVVWCSDVYGQRWSSVTDVFRRLHGSFALAIVHLSEEQQDVIRRIEAKKYEIHAAQHEWLRREVFANAGRFIELKIGAAGESVHEEIDELEADVRTLAPGARLG